MTLLNITDITKKETYYEVTENVIVSKEIMYPYK